MWRLRQRDTTLEAPKAHDTVWFSDLEELQVAAETSWQNVKRHQSAQLFCSSCSCIALLASNLDCKRLQRSA